MLGEPNIYDRMMIQVLVAWDWTKPHWNTYSSFFDNAASLFCNNKNMLDQMNEKFKLFKIKYGMEYTAAEIKVFRLLVGQSGRRMVKGTIERIETYGNKKLDKSQTDREIDWMDITDDLREIKIWIQGKVRELASEIQMDTLE